MSGAGLYEVNRKQGKRSVRIWYRCDDCAMYGDLSGSCADELFAFMRDRHKCVERPALLVDLTELPPVEMPNTGGNTGPREPRPGKPSCVCGQRPRRKVDGQYAAHRVVVDDPSSPYCPGGAERSY